jgi:hypothetical protein
VIAQLAISAGARSRGEDVDSPFTTAEVADLVAEHGEAVDTAAARWMKEFTPEAAEVSSLLDRLLSRRPSPLEIDYLNAYVAGLTARDRISLVEPEIKRCLKSDPRTDLLRVLGIAELDDSEIANLIAKTFASASNMDHRRRCLEVWAEARISDTPSRARLIGDVLLPTARSGVGGLDLALRHADLWRDPPHGTKGPLRDLRKSATPDQKDRLNRALVEANLIKEEKSWLGLGPSSYKDVD